MTNEEKNMGDRLKRVAQGIFGGVSVLAQALEIQQPTLSQYINGKIKIGTTILERLQSIGVNLDFILHGDGQMVADEALVNRAIKDANEELAKKGGRFKDKMEELLKDAVSREKPSVLDMVFPEMKPPSQKARSQFGKPMIDRREPLLVPLMSASVRAGKMTYTEDDIDTYVDVLKQYGEGTILCQVVGDSMKSASIVEGMRLVVDTRRAPVSGDIVVAEKSGELTVKRLKKNGDKWLLSPENTELEVKKTEDGEEVEPKYKAIKLTDEFNIIGVVRKAELLFP